MYRVGSKVTVQFKIIRMDHKYVLLEAVDILHPNPLHLSIHREDLDEHFKRCIGCKNLTKTD
jgi:hypothetical protein